METEKEKKNIALINGDPGLIKDFIDKTKESFNIYLFENGIKFYDWASRGGKVDAVVSAGPLHTPSGLPLVRQLRLDKDYKKIPFVFLINNTDRGVINKLLKEKVTEVFNKKFDKDDFLLRVNWLINNPIEEPKEEKEEAIFNYKIPLAKRVFDIAIALTALIILSPVLLLVILFIKLESRGPIFYISKRVGTGYQIFDFYKFRSMRVGADNELKNIAHLNQYKKAKSETIKNLPLEKVNVSAEVKAELINKNSADQIVEKDSIELSSYLKNQFDTVPDSEVNNGLCEECKKSGNACQSLLFLNGEALCERIYLEQKKEKDEGKFIKITNDPRVTKIGKFIRNTSIDELPQLINVLKGDMSIVGNRPLPLYEAEKITTDAFNLRFLAPAGITGLWQVTKRGTSEMSEEDRMQLDNEYAKSFSIKKDIEIIMRTIPALLQKENV